LAPGNFGTLSGALLIGNFGDGKINGYDLTSGRYLGTIANSTGVAFAAPGLWGIYFGNDSNNQPHGTLYYAAGVNGQLNGNYGRIDLGATPPVIGTAPTATIVVPASPLSGTVTLSSVPTSTSGATIAKVEFLAGTALIGTATSAPYSISWNTTTVTNGAYALRAVATDLNGNVGSSAVVNATVTN
jgi:Bacterial Ig domain